MLRDICRPFEQALGGRLRLLSSEYTPISLLPRTMVDVSIESHRFHVPGDVQAHILDYMSYAEVQRLRATGPVFLHAALRARHSVICLDLTLVTNKKKSPIRCIRRLRRVFNSDASSIHADVAADVISGFRVSLPASNYTGRAGGHVAYIPPVLRRMPQCRISFECSLACTTCES
jgi:hypothetical protein